MTDSLWRKAIQAAADPARTKQFLAQMRQTVAGPVLEGCDAERARILTALWSGSQAMSELLLKHPEWLQEILSVESLQHPRQVQGLRREVSNWLQPALQTKDYVSALAHVRQFKQREMLRIATRDLARLGEAPFITREISQVADIALSTVFEICRRQSQERFGCPYHQDLAGQWQPTELAVLGLGKLGGQELNYSSDVDLLFVYSDEGVAMKDPPRNKRVPEQAMASHSFFKRLAESFIAEVTRSTADGTLYRIDMRLRPEGNHGPLVRSLSSYENFYAQWGQTWERMMLIKARGVAGDESLAGEFLETMQPFRYPRSLGEGALQEIAAMKTRIEQEVVRSGEVERNVKLGRGGIREIEFIAQTTQLMHGGRIPFLQGGQTLPALRKMVDYKFLDSATADTLSQTYCFLRDVEHRLQMENNLQTHTIPTSAPARERLARLMGCSKASVFERQLSQRMSAVRVIYDRMLKTSEAEAKTGLPTEFEEAEAETEWRKILLAHRFRDPDHSLRLLKEFVRGPGFGHVSQRTQDLAMQMIGRFLALCPQGTGRRPPLGQGVALPSLHGTAGSHERIVHAPLSDPDRVLARLDRFIAAYGARSTMLEVWSNTPSLFELLLLLFDRSEFLAEAAIRTPDLVDELVGSDRLRRTKSTAEILRDLRYGQEDANQALWLRKYHQAEQMRLGLRDILGLADYEQNLKEVSALADACLQYALEVVLRQNRIKSQPISIVGLGKLGGLELNYGSDLDILFVASPSERNLPKLQKVAAELIDLLSAPSELGIVSPVDTRLRPDGTKGLLVNSIAAYEEYYRTRAQLWEIQALTRTRAVAGNPELGQRFQAMTATLANFHPANLAAGFSNSAASHTMARSPRPASRSSGKGLVAYTPDWKQEIARMRQRIEKERTPAGQDELAIKTGAGGLVDAEFIAQTLALEFGWQEANSLAALERGDQEGALPDGKNFLSNYRHLRRVEGILRRWSYEGESVLPTDDAAYYRVAIRCGFSSADEFRKSLAAWRRGIRKVYQEVYRRSS